MNRIIGITGLLVAILFMTTCSSQKLSKVDEKEIRVVTELRNQINKYVNDNERRTNLLEIADDIEQETRSFFTFYQEHNNRIIQVNKNYKTTRQDFDNIINQFNDEYENYLRMLVQKRSVMRELTSDAEWEKIMDRDLSFIPG